MIFLCSLLASSDNVSLIISCFTNLHFFSLSLPLTQRRRKYCLRMMTIRPDERALGVTLAKKLLPSFAQYLNSNTNSSSPVSINSELQIIYSQVRILLWGDGIKSEKSQIFLGSVLFLNAGKYPRCKIYDFSDLDISENFRWSIFKTFSFE